MKNLQLVFTETFILLGVDVEEAEIEMCMRHKRYFKEAKAIGISAWCEKHHRKGQIDVQRDICLFQARYSSRLKHVFKCDGCSQDVEQRWYRCLHCIVMDMCANCYDSGKNPSGNLDSHEVIELRFVKALSNFKIEKFALFNL